MDFRIKVDSISMLQDMPLMIGTELVTYSPHDAPAATDSTSRKFCPSRTPILFCVLRNAPDIDVKEIDYPFTFGKVSKYYVICKRSKSKSHRKT